MPSGAGFHLPQEAPARPCIQPSVPREVEVTGVQWGARLCPGLRLLTGVTQLRGQEQVWRETEADWCSGLTGCPPPGMGDTWFSLLVLKTGVRMPSL